MLNRIDSPHLLQIIQDALVKERYFDPNFAELKEVVLSFEYKSKTKEG